MRKVLLATTALGMSAGVAFAQDMGMADDGMMMEPASSVTVSGDGRMGIISTKDEELKFSSRVRVKFALAATLDNGLSAGGDIRADNAGSGMSGTGGKIFLSGPFGTLSMGHVDPGAKAAVGHVASVGYVNQGDPNEITYIRGGTDGEEPALLYTLPKLGPVQVYASVGMHTSVIKDSEGNPVPANDPPEYTHTLNTKLSEINAGNVDDAVTSDLVKKTQTEISADTLSIGAKADMEIGGLGTAWIGGGFEASTNEAQDGQIVLGAGASVSGFTGTIVAGMQGRDAGEDGANNDVEQFAVSAGYSAGQMGVTVFYTDDKDYGGDEALGAGFNWKLGGGAELKAGFTNWPAKTEGAEDHQTADLGVTFAF
ncbi:MAG: porin [Rhodobacter sp.]|nr:porin [Rhodobacter sp.]